MNTKTIVLSLVAVAVVGFAALQLNQNTNTPSNQNMQNNQMQEKTQMRNQGGDTTMTDSTFKDGTYEAQGNYISPAGPETVGVTVTLKDGIIVDSEFEVQSKHPTSMKMQEIFKDAYKEQVLGKNIADIDLDVVGTSSLTPNGFEDALKKIMEQAS